jgi:hypothetical protein|tara:strand:- start:58 stop:759 length:702 start_codon:yes stop_codon:yes gene_type:complete
MLDPVTIGTAVQVASSAFSMLQKGFAAGRELEQMSADLSRWMSAVSDVDHLEKAAKNPSLFLKLTKGKSIESLALEAFTAKKKLEDQRYALKQMIQFSRGTAAWNELLALEGSIRKQRQEAIYAAQQRRQKIIEYVAWIFMGLLAAGLLTLFVMLLKGHAAKAQPDHVVCRLVGCEIINKKRYCVYRGVKTQETVVLEPSEWFPREYQCKYDPDAPKPPTLQETLKAIKESQR